MKISELISHLQSLKDTHGDLYTVCVGRHEDQDLVDEVTIYKTGIMDPQTGMQALGVDVAYIKC